MGPFVARGLTLWLGWLAVLVRGAAAVAMFVLASALQRPAAGSRRLGLQALQEGLQVCPLGGC